MEWLWVGLGIAVALTLLTALTCFYITFYARRRKITEEFPIPNGKAYIPYREQMVGWMKETRSLPREAVSIRSFDGLTLRGYYYEYAPGAPIELMMPGYRGLADRDLCGGVQRCFALGRSALVVDQRACGDSEGRVITFGLRESRDCQDWAWYLHRRFEGQVPIYLTGISMGAATVLMAAGGDVPPSVVGVIADCGYSSAKAIIGKVIRQLHLPRFLYAFVRLGAVLFGGFDPDKACPVEAVKHCRVPVMFAHGEGDDFVPCDMSRENYAACTAPKVLFTVPGAAHGLAYLGDPEGYIRVAREAQQLGDTAKT